MTLKGDVDNLGLIIQTGLEHPTFAKMATLSRQMNAFFSVYLPWLCAKEFPSTYTVFAGGDDFFLIGPWYSTIKLAHRIKDEFRHYVAENPDIHFSAGLSMTKPGLPIRQMASLAEDALEEPRHINQTRQNPLPRMLLPASAIKYRGRIMIGLCNAKRGFVSSRTNTLFPLDTCMPCCIMLRWPNE